MQIAKLDIERIGSEIELIDEQLDLDHKHLVELGCGRADITRVLAQGGPGRTMLATEVDAVQHARHLEFTDLPNVTFRLAGAEDIPAPDNSADVVFMFKSLHHVPIDQMDRALLEIHRVLKPGGLAWISEPIFAGDFNEVTRLFHDEEEVREAAFDAVRRAVEGGLLELQGELFFLSPRHFANFADYEAKIMRATHTEHHLSMVLHAAVRARFESFMQPGGADFLTPNRVDVLQKV